MSTADRFDRYVESLMGDLAGQGNPAYLDDALATATAGPQRRPSIVGRLFGGPLASRSPVLRTAMMGLPVVLAVTIGLLGVLVIGGPGETPSPSPMPSLGTAFPDGTPEPTANPPSPIASSPTTTAVEPCPGYRDAADALQWEQRGGVFAGTPLPTYPEGAIAAFAPDLPSGRPAVVLIDVATGSACRLVDLEGEEEVRQFEWTADGQALAFSTGRRLLVWATGGILEVHRVGQGRPPGTTFEWSPTGDIIAVNGPLILAFADGSKREVSIDAAQELHWSPDGRRLHAAFAAHVGGALVHTLITDGGQPDPIDIGSTVDEWESVAGWIDNDTLIIGGSPATDGYDAYDVASGTRQPWSEASTESFGLMNHIGYAPGLTALALFANSSADAQATPQDLIVQELPSGEIHVLGTRLFPPSNAVGGGAWSPDGTRIAVSLEGVEDDPRLVPGLWIYSLAGREPTHIISAFQVRVSNGAWGPLP
jgi:hypothetical protein